MSVREPGGPPKPRTLAVASPAPHSEISRRRHLTVLIASSDRDYLRLARTVLRMSGHTVFTTSVRPDRVRRQVRLRRPDVVLLDCDPDDLVRAGEDLTTFDVALLGVRDDPGPGTSHGAAPISKWVSTDALADAVARAAADRSAATRRHLRVVGPR